MSQIVESLLASQREDQGWKAICKIQENNGNIVGCGCLVYDPQIKDPELSQYCIISSSKVILHDNLPEYHIVFERKSTSKNPRDILLRDIIKKYLILGSGLVLIFIDGTSSPQLRHRGCILLRQRKCSVLNHLPEISSSHEGREKFCYIGRERHKYDETSGIDLGSVSNGCVLFERDPESKKLTVVGIISCFNSEQEEISPIWLTSSSLENIIEEERKKEKQDMKMDEHDWEKEEEERTNKEQQDSKRKEEDWKRIEEQGKQKEEEDRKRKEEQDRKKEEEDRKRKEEQDRKKEEEDRKRKEEQDRKKEEEEGKREEEQDRRKEEEDRKRKEEQDRKKEEEDRKRKEEQDRKKEEEDRKRKEEQDRKKEEEDRKRKEEQDRKKEEEDRKRKEEQDRKKEEEDRKRKEEQDRRKEEEDRKRKEEQDRKKEEEDRKRKEEQDRKKEEEDRKRKEEQDRKKEEENRKRKEEQDKKKEEEDGKMEQEPNGPQVTPRSTAPTPNHDDAVETIQSIMQHSTSQTEQKMTDDVVDARVKQNGSQVNARLSTSVKEIPLRVYGRICVMLNDKRDVKFDDFRMLAEKVGLDKYETNFIAQMKNPTEEILKTWSKKPEATVGKLIEILKGEDLDRMDVVEVLEDWVNEK